MNVATQRYRWRNVEIVGGGFVTGILFHPRRKDLLYARTDIGGAYRWNPATRRWIPLLDWLGKDDWNLYGVESLGIDPADPNRLYAAVGTYTNDWAGNGAILRSTDQGRSWRRTDLPFKLGGNEDGRSIGERLAARRNTVWFGSRHEGLWRSDDYAKTWRRVESFPVKGRTDGVGVGFVLVQGDTVYAAARTPAGALWRSADAGRSWEVVPGQPRDLLPHHGAFDNTATLYLTYSNGPGPNGVTDGAVWKWNSRTGVWTEITPQKLGNFGYAGLAIDPARPGTIFVTSLDKWSTGDDLWRSVDGGARWIALKEKSVRDSRGAPYLNWGRPQADMGHWMGALALDPFRPGHVLYGTGATIWGSDDADRSITHWTVRAQGIEETAILDLASPPAGPPLLSAMGDIGGFRHDDLAQVPTAGRSLSPMFNTTVSLDFAEEAPNLVVVSGHSRIHGALSRNGGVSWKPFGSEPAGTRGPGQIALGADGKTILWAPQGAPLSRSTDGGNSWTLCDGPTGTLDVAADRFDPNRFWAWDLRAGTLWRSEDGGAHFTPLTPRVPAAGDGTLRTPFRAPRNAWLCAGNNGLWHIDARQELAKVESVAHARDIGFGMPKAGTRYPILFLNGTIGDEKGVFRSDDVGESWIRLDDPAHRFGTMNVIAGDPRIHGRVYLGTNGRGILYADPESH